MIRYFAPLAVAFAVASAAQAQTAQTFSRTYVTTDGRGNSTTTTIQAPATPAGASAIGLIANQTVYGGYPSYTNGVPSYGANCPPTYGYAGYGYVPPAYGYGYQAPAPCPPPAYPYGYPPQAYYIPGETTYLPGPGPGGSGPSWGAPVAITRVPQVITTPGYPAAVPAYPYGGYAPYNYGWNTQTTVAQGGISFNRGGLSLSVGGRSVTRR